jgi:hypothetical protein
MRLPRVKFTVRRAMAVVALAALLSLAVANVCREYPSTEHRVAILVASVVAGAYGLAAMRRPWVFLAPLVVVWAVAPTVDHPSFDVFNLSGGACFLGGIIGGSVGLISRFFRWADDMPVAPERPKPK